MQINYLSKLSAPVSVNLEVTDKCNLSCGFCFNAAPAYENMMSKQEQKDISEKGAGELLMQVRKRRILQTIDELAEHGVFEIRLFGGEFTVFKDWKEIIRYIHQKKMFISFVSNGYLIDYDAVKLFEECRVKDCTISVHGPEETHDAVVKKAGSFRRAMQAVSLLAEVGIHVTIAYTPNASNLNHLYDFVSMLNREYRVKSFSISRLFSDDRYEHLTLEDYHHLLKEIDRCRRDMSVDIMLADSFPRCQVPMRYWQYLGYCSQGVGFAQVDFNGNIKNCSATSKIIGNVISEKLSAVWHEKLIDHRNLDHLPTSCKICPIFCGGGCTASRGVENAFAPDEFIPWPKDESLIQAVLKAAYNRFRKIAHRLIYSSQYTRSRAKTCVTRYPRVVERYQLRAEGENFLVMFENAGTRFLTPLAVSVLKMLNGNHDILSISTELSKSHSGADEVTIQNIIKQLPVL